MKRHNPNQLALFTERAVAGKIVFAFAVKRHFSGRARRGRFSGQLPSRSEMRALHELCCAAWNGRVERQPSCEEWGAMATFQALDGE